ncbi:MAG: ABC transporter ATP-binding protein [Polaromonas sp.]
MSAQPILEIKDLTVVGPKSTILDKVSVHAFPGEVIGLIGESGAGKSTLGLAALGFVRPPCRAVGGTVRLGERSVLSLSAQDLRALRQTSVSYVAQSAAAAFNPAYPIGVQVMEVPLLRGLVTKSEAAMQAQDLFAKLELPDPANFGKRYPHQVSGGQLQRAMTAMALASNPELIIFDEPTTALDVTTQLEVLRTMRLAIRARKIAALYISHDLAVVSQVADRILVLRHGKMVEEGPTQTLISAPRTEYARALVSARVDGKAPQSRLDEPSILEARGVTATYGKVPVLSKVSFTLRKGHVLAVVGESGSGKSTIARVITGLLPPKQGEIVFCSEKMPPSLKGRSKDHRRRIQLIHQLPDVALNPRQTIRQIIGRPIELFFRKSAAEIDARVRDLLRAVELNPELIDRYPGSLSGGQKQRVCIARALAAEPDVIICDEVTSALDPLVEESVIDLLKRLQSERHLSILFITHNLALTKRFAHDTVVLRRGEVVEAGPTAGIFQSPGQGYTRNLLSAVPSMAPGWLDQRLGEAALVA